MGEEKRPESYGKSLLIDAVSRENVEDVKWLTTYIGCSVNDRSNDGTTLLSTSPFPEKCDHHEIVTLIFLL